MLQRVGYFLLLLIFQTVIVYSGEFTDEKETNAAWYHFLEKVSAKPFEEQLAQYEKYLEKYPGFEIVYFKIMYTFMAARDLQGAEQFFTNLGLNPEHRLYSHWMLANIYFKQKRYNEALAAFLYVMKCDKPPIKIFYDYWRFISNTSVKPAIADTIFISGYDKYYKSIYYIYRDYWLSNYKAVVNRINELPQGEMNKEPVLYALGYSRKMLNYYDQADSIAQVGIMCAQKNQNRIYEIKFLYLRGLLYYYKSDYNKALELFHAAEKLGQVLKSPEYLILVYEFLGETYLNINDLESSKDYYLRARETELLFDVIENTDAYNYKIAWIKYQRKQYSQALQELEKIELQAVMENDNKLLLDISNLKLSIYDGIFLNEMAAREYQKIITLTEKDSLLHQSMSTQLAIMQANIFFNRGEYENGRALLWPLLHQLAKKNDYYYHAWCLAVIAYSFNKQQKYDKAEYYYQEAYNIAMKTKDRRQTVFYLPYIIENLGLCGKYDLALSSVDSLIKIGNDLNNVDMLRNAYWRKGQIYERTKDLEQAIKNYQNAISYTETFREKISEDEIRIGYFLANYKVYRGLTRCYYNKYLELGNPADLDSLFFYEEMQRGRSFKDNLLDTKKSHKLSLENTAYEEACRILQGKQRELRLQAGTLYSDEEWDRIMSELEAAKYEVMTQKLSSIDTLNVTKLKHTKPSFFTVSKLQEKMQKNNCGLIMYHIDELACFALVVNTDTAGVVPLSIHPDSLRTMIDSLMLPMRDIDEQNISKIPFYAGLAHCLYTKLYQPIAERFALPERLFIVPEGILANLPFEILLQKAPEKPVYTPADAPVYAKSFLQHKHAFFYSPTSAVFRQKKNVLHWGKSMLIIANPQTNDEYIADNYRQFRTRAGWRFDPLPFADNEGQNIKQIEPRAQLYNHEDADEKVFLQRAQHYNIVHFATHAFVDTSFDAFSGLILSTGKDSTNDGILMGYEIKSLHLDCDLVTLSACETGRGKNVVAEGVLGLPRLFLSAGASAALVSQWKVDDRFTSIVMPEFYRNYLQKKMTRADALAQSRRVILDTLAPAEGIHYQHPFFWSAFTLYGDPGPASVSGMPVIVSIGVIIGLVGILFIYLNYKKRQPGN